VENVLFTQTEPPTQGTHGVMAGAARTKDAMGVFYCNSDSPRCDAVSVQYPGTSPSIAARAPLHGASHNGCSDGVSSPFPRLNSKRFFL
jgi:hypothetical protein